MNIDSFIRIGSSHIMCEDYILYGEKPFPYVVLADGCSSSKNSDIGARLLCQLVKTFINNINKGNYLIKYNNIIDFILYSIKPIIDILGLEPHNLDATLIVSFIYNNIVYVYIYGDGCIFTISDRGDKDLYLKSFDNNMPEYLSYKIFPEKYDKATSKYSFKETLLKYRSSWKNTNSLEIECLNIFKFPLDMYKCVLISSDGLTSFSDKLGNTVNVKDILKEITSFKNTNGEFIKRRVKKMIKDYTKKDIYPSDDISIGGFHR